MFRFADSRILQQEPHLRGQTYQFGALLAAERRGVVSLVPLSEGRGVDHDDGVLHERLGAHKLIVTGVVHDVDDTRLTGDGCKTGHQGLPTEQNGDFFLN